MSCLDGLGIENVSDGQAPTQQPLATAFVPSGKGDVKYFLVRTSRGSDFERLQTASNGCTPAYCQAKNA